LRTLVINGMSSVDATVIGGSDYTPHVEHLGGLDIDVGTVTYTDDEIRKLILAFFDYFEATKDDPTKPRLEKILFNKNVAVPGHPWNSGKTGNFHASTEHDTHFHVSLLPPKQNWTSTDIARTKNGVDQALDRLKAATEVEPKDGLVKSQIGFSSIL